MSEELLQTIPLQIGRYTYYRLGSTTLEQLKSNGIIPRKDYNTLKNKKPDGLVVYHGNIKAVVEYKQPKMLSTEKLIEKAIKQEIDVAKVLCKILILTDGNKSYWINALNGKPIKDAKGDDLNILFHPFVAKNTAKLEYVIEEIDGSITASNSIIRSAKLVDPTPLAARLWQTIWVATGKSPVKCLYNVVELFIFKFLSDLNVLDQDTCFNRIYTKAKDNPEDALDFYAKNTRKKIVRLFPHGSDGTTIINGTIFVNESGEANLSQSILFKRSLEHLAEYSQNFGSFTKIDKQFKTKLYESFLKQEVEALGQYFTPRKVIQSVIRMAGIDEPAFQYNNKRICDPFCGVGGFLLEILNMNESMKNCYTPKDDGTIDLKFVLNGFDKGFERDDERTIILAKANMLIYLAEILFANPSCSKEFSRIFNETFSLFRDNLGTFGHIIKNEDKKYDYILSNPPYVTKGSGIIKEELKTTPRTANEYPINGLGLESISLEWIVKSLNKGGKAFLIIPDGILSRVGSKLRNHILKECYLDAIVSLPVRTFFSNSEHTYILSITKKQDSSEQQKLPVFTYLVSNIGERLTSVKREEIAEDDLPEMEKLFRIFSSAKDSTKKMLESESTRCKIQSITRFQKESHWVIDRWWTRDELLALGIMETEQTASKNEVESIMAELNKALSEYEKCLSMDALDDKNSKNVEMGDKSLFNMFTGKRELLKDVGGSDGIPVYSANVFTPMGFVKKTRIKNFNNPSILWGIDGNFEFNILPPKKEFETTDHCGTIQVLDESILPEYLLYALNKRRIEESFDRSFRASLSNIRKFKVKIPVDKKGHFDTKKQGQMALQYRDSQQKKDKLDEIKQSFDKLFAGYVSTIG